MELLATLELPIDQALRHGAAAQEAAMKADKKFQEFFALTNEKLDAPLPVGM